MPRLARPAPGRRAVQPTRPPALRPPAHQRHPVCRKHYIGERDGPKRWAQAPGVSPRCQPATPPGPTPGSRPGARPWRPPLGPPCRARRPTGPPCRARRPTGAPLPPSPAPHWRPPAEPRGGGGLTPGAHLVSLRQPAVAHRVARGPGGRLPRPRGGGRREREMERERNGGRQGELSGHTAILEGGANAWEGPPPRQWNDDGPC